MEEMADSPVERQFVRIRVQEGRMEHLEATAAPDRQALQETLAMLVQTAMSR
jgi:hypothetical protein